MNNVEVLEQFLALIAEDPLPPIRRRPHSRHKSWAKFVSYEEAWSAVRAADLKSWGEYVRWYKSSENIGVPIRPDKYYAGKGWEDWPKFLTGVNGVEFVSYAEACRIVKEAGINSRQQYRKWAKMQHLVPSRPDWFYDGSGWEGWTKFLTGSSEREIVPYGEASRIVQRAGVRTKTEFTAWIKDHKDTGVASNPAATYASRWSSWPTFLAGHSKVEIVSYEEACRIVRDAGVKTRTEFQTWILANGTRSGKTKTHRGVPASPDRAYCGRGWVSWGEFLRQGGSLPAKFVLYDEACRLVRAAGVNTVTEFNAWIKSHTALRVPAAPHNTYAGRGWESWPAFLNNGNERQEWVSYDEACRIVREAGLKSAPHFSAWAKNHKSGIPRAPQHHYTEWEGWPKFLGTRKYRSFATD